MVFSFSVEHEVDQQDVDFLIDGVRQYNHEIVGKEDSIPLAAYAKDKRGNIIAGVAGRTIYGWYFIHVVWVDHSMRGQGVGRKVMQLAEQAAIERGCVAAQVDTLSFQGEVFYQKLGYTIVGTVADCPPGHQRLFLSKRFAD